MGDEIKPETELKDLLNAMNPETKKVSKASEKKKEKEKEEQVLKQDAYLADKKTKVKILAIENKDNVVIEKNGAIEKVAKDTLYFKEKKVNKSYTLASDKKKLIKAIDYIDNNNIMPLLLEAIELNLITGIRGPTGTGKTHLIQEIAEKIGKPVTILNMNCNTTVDEIKGKYSLNAEGKLSWIKSAVVKAMELGHWLCLEEANFMSEEMASVLYSLLDFRKNLVIDEHEGEVIGAHKDFRIFMTMNPNYEGTTRMNDAIVNRVGVWLDVAYLPIAEETNLLCKRYSNCNKDDVECLCKIADKIRKSGDYRHLSTRTLENTCRLLQINFPFKTAIECTVINTLADEETEKKKIMEIVNVFYEDKIKFVPYKEFVGINNEQETQEKQRN